MNATNNSKSPKSLKILFADDEEALQDLMREELPRMGHEVTVCPDGLTAVAALDKNKYDCILVDLDMPGLTGIEVIQRCKQQSPDTDSVVLTGKGTMASAVAALREGTVDYLTKPCKLIELDALLKRIAKKRELENKYRSVIRRLERVEGKSELIGGSAAMDRVRSLISKVAPTNSSVLILGETGTGKELVARALHNKSHRHDQPFVAVNCGALPENLIESELFGHRKGAFTGADDHRIGLFEMAHQGTIFLDEIGELPKALQSKLLRVLESGEIRRVGDNESFKVDVRLVCATHQDVKHMVADGDFREDLMYRINTFEINVPALRDRASDLEELATHLFHRFRQDAPQHRELFSPAAVELLQAHDWPGNVRELANVIERAAILCDEPPIQPEHLPTQFGATGARRSFGPVTLRELEMQAIHESLDRHNGNKPAAAEELGVSLKTLYNKLNQAGQLKEAA